MVEIGQREAAGGQVSGEWRGLQRFVCWWPKMSIQNRYLKMYQHYPEVLNSFLFFFILKERTKLKQTLAF